MTSYGGIRGDVSYWQSCLNFLGVVEVLKCVRIKCSFYSHFILLAGLRLHFARGDFWCLFVMIWRHCDDAKGKSVKRQSQESRKSFPFSPQILNNSNDLLEQCKILFPRTVWRYVNVDSFLLFKMVSLFFFPRNIQLI